MSSRGIDLDDLLDARQRLRSQGGSGRTDGADEEQAVDFASMSLFRLAVFWAMLTIYLVFRVLAACFRALVMFVETVRRV